MSIHDITIVIQPTKSSDLPFEIYGPAGEFLDGVIPAELRKEIAECVAQVDARFADKRGEPRLLNQKLQEVGRTLFASLDASDQRLRKTLSHLPTSDSHPPQLQLRLRDTEAATWPWELLCVPDAPLSDDMEDSPFLALSSRLRLSRYPEKGIPITNRECLEKLRVLVAIASPTNLAPLAQLAAREIEEILRLPESLGNRLHLEILRPATPKTLLERLSKAAQPFHVLHIIAHGHVQNGEAGIYLEAEGGTTKFLSANLMGYMLRLAHPKHIVAVEDKTKVLPLYPRLVILDACHSARIDQEIPSVAQALMDCGVPAIIGMRSRVSPAFVTIFSGGLYAHLLDGIPIDAAVARCRHTVYTTFGPDVEWSLPLLQLRVGQGELFKFNRDSHEGQRWVEQLQLISDLAGKQAGTAMLALVKLGVSALALLVATALSYPLNIVRARAVALLRAIPQTPDTQDQIIQLIGPAAEREPDAQVRAEIARYLALPRARNAAIPSLERLVQDPDPQVRQIAREGLVPSSVFGYDLRQLNDQLHQRLIQISTDLEHLSTMISGALQPDTRYTSYLELLRYASTLAADLQQRIMNAKDQAAEMSSDEVIARVKPLVDNWLRETNAAIKAADGAMEVVQGLALQLVIALGEIAITLEHELELITDLNKIVTALNGIIIEDRLGQVQLIIEVDRYRHRNGSSTHNI